MSNIKQIWSVKEAPFIIAALFAAAAWCLTHVVDRALERPIVEFSVEHEMSEFEKLDCPNQTKTTSFRFVTFRNLSASEALRGIRIIVDLPSNKETRIVERLCWANPDFTISGARDVVDDGREIEPSSRREGEIDELLPGARSVLRVALSEPDANLRVLAKSALQTESGKRRGYERASFEFREAGVLTFLIRNELTIIGAFLVLFLILGFWALGKTPS